MAGGLTALEKAAGRHFRGAAEQVLAVSLLDHPDSAPCSYRVKFFRHECAVEGRTRSVRLEDMTLTSPEMLVSIRGGELAVIEAALAERLVSYGMPVEYEVILAGKFSFSWKYGECGRCGLTVMSREGVLKDERPRQPEKVQRDLMSGMPPLVMREHME